MMTEFSFLAGSSSLICICFCGSLITDRFGRCQRCIGPPLGDRADGPLHCEPKAWTAHCCLVLFTAPRKSIRYSAEDGTPYQASWGTENESPVSVRMSGKKKHKHLTFLQVRYTETTIFRAEQGSYILVLSWQSKSKCDDTKITSSYRLSLLADSKIKHSKCDHCRFTNESNEPFLKESVQKLTNSWVFSLNHSYKRTSQLLNWSIYIKYSWNDFAADIYTQVRMVNIAFLIHFLKIPK